MLQEGKKFGLLPEIQWFSNFNVHQGHLYDLMKQIIRFHPRKSSAVQFWGGGGDGMFNKFPGDDDSDASLR